MIDYHAVASFNSTNSRQNIITNTTKDMISEESRTARNGLCTVPEWRRQVGQHNSLVPCSCFAIQESIISHAASTSRVNEKVIEVHVGPTVPPDDCCNACLVSANTADVFYWPTTSTTSKGLGQPLASATHGNTTALLTSSVILHGNT